MIHPQQHGVLHVRQPLRPERPHVLGQRCQPQADPARETELQRRARPYLQEAGGESGIDRRPNEVGPVQREVLSYHHFQYDSRFSHGSPVQLSFILFLAVTVDESANHL